MDIEFNEVIESKCKRLREIISNKETFLDQERKLLETKYEKYIGFLEELKPGVDKTVLGKMGAEILFTSLFIEEIERIKSEKKICDEILAKFNSLYDDIKDLSKLLSLPTDVFTSEVEDLIDGWIVLVEGINRYIAPDDPKTEKGE